MAPGDATLGCLFAGSVVSLTTAQDMLERACIVAAQGTLAITSTSLPPTLQNTRSWQRIFDAIKQKAQE